jgi:hypothetical protein
MEEEDQLLLTKEFDAAQNIWNKVTDTASSAVQSGVQTLDDFVDQNIPGGEQFTARWRKGALRFLRGTVGFVQQELEAADRQVDDPIDHIGDIPYFAVGAFSRGKQQYTENARTMAEAAGIDPRAGDVLGEVAGEIATFGAGKLTGAVLDAVPPGAGGMSPQLAMAGGMPAPTQLTPQIKGGQVFMSTTSPEYTAKGMGEGVAQTPKYAPAVKIYTERGQAYADAVEQVQSNLASGRISESRLKKTLAKIEKIRKGDASTFEYDPANPYVYREGIESSFNPYVSTPEYTGLRKDAPRGVVSKRAKEVQVDDPYETGRKAQQHHILAKAETKPFADTLMGLIKKGVADEDDLVNFFVWPEQYDMFPGNVLNNLLDMGEITHTVAKKDPMALHKILKEAGLEFGSGTEKQIIKNYGLDKVTNTNELMQAYDRYLQEIAIPSKEITYKVHDMWYDKTVKQLKGVELEEFKEKYSKLSDPRKNR